MDELRAELERAGIKADFSAAAPNTSIRSGAKCSARASAFQPDLRYSRSARAGAGSQRLLRRAGYRARPVAQCAERVRRLHRQPERQRLSLAAHRGDRPRRQSAGGADSHLRHARRGRARRVRALALQRCRQRAQERRQLRRKDRLAAPGARMARGNGRHRAIWPSNSRRANRTASTCSRPDGHVVNLAYGLDAARFRLSHSHRGRPSLPRRESERSHRAADLCPADRRAGRNSHRQGKRAAPRLAAAESRAI